MHSKEFSGNQGKHQNFNPSIIPYKFGLIFMGMALGPTLVIKSSFSLVQTNNHASYFGQQVIYLN